MNAFDLVSEKCVHGRLMYNRLVCLEQRNYYRHCTYHQATVHKIQQLTIPTTHDIVHKTHQLDVSL